MHGSETKDGQHSTPENPEPRSQLWPRFLLSLALVGLLVGLMIGRVVNPDPVSLDRIEVEPDALILWFADEPRVTGGTTEGAVVLSMLAHGAQAAGQVPVQGKQANWRILHGGDGVVLNVVAARQLNAHWVGERVDGRWRLKVSLEEVE